MTRPPSSSEHLLWTRIGLWLVGGTAFYNAIEAGVALWSGVHARSIALMGFGFDSIIELAAAGAMLWRLAVEARGAGRDRVELSERRVERFIGVTFLLLAAWVTIQAGWSLWARDVPGESWLGVALSGVSLVVMPVISLAKLRVAKELDSAALRAEAKETLACSYLSLTLLVGLFLNASLGWWWADPVAALLMVPWLLKEGREGVTGEEDEDHDDDVDGKVDRA